MGKVLDNKTSFYRPNQIFIKTLRDVAADTKDAAYSEHMNNIADRHEELGARRKKLKKPK